MTDNAIVVSDQAGFLAPVVNVEDALAAYQAKKMLIDKIMKPEFDFGVIPGTSKPTLLKAGAEKATSFFGLHPVFTDAAIVEDWTGKDHGGEPFFYYRRTCNLYKKGVLIASVDGSANSWEKKHRYRWVEESKVPSTVDKTQLKTMDGKISEFAFAIDKAETTGKYGKPAEYWQMFRNAISNKTAVSFMRKTSKGESAAWEIGGTLYCLPNEDPADLANTLLKMADKRALVAATLIATGLSEYFTQDIEDYVDPTKPIEGHFEDVTPTVKPVKQQTKVQPPEPDFPQDEKEPATQEPFEPNDLSPELQAIWNQSSESGEAYGLMKTKDLMVRVANKNVDPGLRDQLNLILEYRKEKRIVI